MLLVVDRIALPRALVDFARNAAGVVIVFGGQARHAVLMKDSRERLVGIADRIALPTPKQCNGAREPGRAKARIICRHSTCAR